MRLAGLLHGTLIALFHAGGWRGVLLLGASGAGKSDLALRCLDHDWRLVADDRVITWSAGGRAFGRAPPILGGLIELRGQGMAAAAPLRQVQIRLTAHLRTPGERQPAPSFEAVAEVGVRTVEIAPFEASGPARLRRIVEGLGSAL